MVTFIYPVGNAMNHNVRDDDLGLADRVDLLVLETHVGNVVDVEIFDE